MVRLGELLKIQSHADNYQDMHEYILKCLASYPNVEHAVDKVGNIYAKKGKLEESSYPTFACRTNSSQKITEGFKVVRMGKSHTWMGFKKDGDKIEPYGIGGDAKCGIYLCLKLLETLPAVKCVFFVESGSGFKGAVNADVTFFRDSRWVIEFDRKGNQDIITANTIKETCGADFKDKLENIGKRYDYRALARGTNCDISKLKTEHNLNISVVNISCGYYRANSKEERIIEKDLMQALQYAKDIVNHVKATSVHVYMSYSPSSSRDEDKKRIQTIIPITKALPAVGQTSSHSLRECRRCTGPLDATDVIFCSKCATQVDKSHLNPIMAAIHCSICGIRLFKQEEIAKQQCNKHGAGRICFR